MRKISVITTLMLMIFFSLALNAQGTISLSAHGNFLIPASAEFKDIYGSGQFMPELKVGIKISKGLYVWGGVGLLSASGTTPVLEEEAQSDQLYLSFGAGYEFPLSPKISMKLSAGACSVNYKEESMGIKIDESALGFHIEDELIIKFGKSLFLSISAGYIRAVDQLEATEFMEVTKITLGGFKAGLGLGVRL